MTTAFDDLDDYLALPRTAGTAISTDGQRLVTTIAQLDQDGTGYTSSLWELDPAGHRPARQLTRGLRGESNPAFTAAGDLLFVATRPRQDSDTETAAVWCLPAAGGEAYALAGRPGGVTAVTTAASTDAMIVTAATMPSATDGDTEASLRTGRTDHKVDAILHDSYPVRYWDHDLGPDHPHLFHGACAAGEDPAAAQVKLTDLTPDAGPRFVQCSADLSPDGATVITSGRTRLGRGVLRTQLHAIATGTGESTRILSDPTADLASPVISPDGTMVAYLRTGDSDPQTATVVDLWVAEIDGSNARCLTPDWPLWPQQPVWIPDSTGMLITADHNGRAPIFHVSLSGDINQVTTEDAVMSDVVIHPDGDTAYALRASYAGPAQVVRIDLTDGTVTGLRNPFPQPELPGTLEEVETSSHDGVRIRSWLALPHGADADHPAPLLLWIHGGPLGSWNTWSWRWCPWLLVARGYAVLLPDPALSTGYGQDFIQRGWGEWGDRPYTDLMAATDAAVALPQIDADRTAAMGGSFGGYMANWVAGHTDRFRAIVTHASLWNLDGFARSTDAAWLWDQQMTTQMRHRNSPHRYVDQIATPMLVIHGDRDYRVPIGEGLQLWYQLLAESALPETEAGTEHRFLYFPTENHWVLSPQHTKLWYQVIARFLDTHVRGTEPEPRPGLLG